MGYLNMVDSPVPLLFTLTWDNFLTLRGTQGFYLNYALPFRLMMFSLNMVDCPSSRSLDFSYSPDAKFFFSLFGNLLNGLAVSDTALIQKEAEVMKMETQSRLSAIKTHLKDGISLIKDLKQIECEPGHSRT